MSYRKFKADRIFDGYGFVDQKILITDGNGVVQELVSGDETGDDVGVIDGILSPGLINSHCHLELSHMKGLIPEKTGLVDFVFKVVTERHHSNDEIFAAIEVAENEMFNNGIVAVGDICNNELTLPQKQKHHLHYYNFIESSGWLPSIATQRFQRAESLFNQFSKTGHPCSIVPHAPYSVSQNLWKEIQPFFKNKVVTIHNQETKHEDEFFLEGTGDFTRMYQLMNIDNSHHVPTKRSSIQSYMSNLEDAKNAILVHNTFTQKNDIEWIQSSSTLKQAQLFFCLCVNANLYIEDRFPPINLLRENNCQIVLGTDSLASNWSLDIMDEIRKIKNHHSNIPLEEMLRWSTSNGARALNKQDELGSFEKGKKPGIIVIDEKELTAKRLL